MQLFNHRLVARLTGTLLLMAAAALILPTAVSVWRGDGAQYGLVLAATGMVGTGLLLRNIVGRRATSELHERESFWITTIVWLVMPAAGALPYLLTGSLTTFTDAVFESMSGFTTTGSSVVSDPAELPAGVLLWRAMTQWVGGLGLILLVITLLRRLDGASMQLYAAEFSGTQQRKLHPHMAKSVSRMWQIYTLLTVAETAALYACGNSGLDSVCIAMSTVSTGGFMTAASGLAGYNDATHLVLTIFMFASGVNVALIYNFFTLHWRRLRRSDEMVVYAALFTAAAAICTAAFAVSGTPAGEAVNFSLFHIASTVSTCGFYTTPPPHWPFAASVVTFLLMLSGAMAGSTGGGLKLRRLMTMWLYLRNYFTRMLHPDAVFCIKIDRRVVDADYVNKIFGFVFLYILFVIGGAFALTLCGSGIAEAFCMAAANMSNLGPTPLINSMGANLEYAMMPTAAKWVLMILMLAGRLEIFALLAVVSPSYWRRR